MKKFKYTAYDLERKKFSGYFFANDEKHLQSLLAEQQLFLVWCKAVQDKAAISFFSLKSKIGIKELTHFCRQLAIMINASIELINCLEMLKGQSYSKNFRSVLEMIYEDVKSGMLMSAAMKKHKKVFPNFFINMVYVGEMSSSLEKVLLNIADYYENENQTRAKLKSAMVYPIVLLVLMVGILALMMFLVVPTFRESLSNMEIQMPALTQAIFDASDFVVQNWAYILLGLVVVVLLFKLFKRTKSGKMFFDTLAMKISLTRRYAVAKATAIFSRSFGLLLASGMHVVDAMEVVHKVLNNAYVAKKFEAATEDVRRGVSLTRALEGMKVFPPMLLRMVAVGEKTAGLDESLLRTCNFFDEQRNASLNAIMSLIQPTLMTIMGISIGVIFIAIYSPMLSIMQNVM